MSTTPTAKLLAPAQHCRSCGAPIVWGKTALGKTCPYNVIDGQATTESHFITCPEREQWGKKHGKV